MSIPSRLQRMYCNGARRTLTIANPLNPPYQGDVIREPLPPPLYGVVSHVIL